MKGLTDSQKTFLFKRNVQAGDIQMFPRFGFSVYSSPDWNSERSYLDTNPLTKSLDHERMVIKNVIGDFCQVNFQRRPIPMDMYIPLSQVESRDFVEFSIYFLFCYPAFLIYNFFRRYLWA
jgi:hypothetical protein